MGNVFHHWILNLFCDRFKCTVDVYRCGWNERSQKLNDCQKIHFIWVNMSISLFCINDVTSLTSFCEIRCFDSDGHIFQKHIVVSFVYFSIFKLEKPKNHTSNSNQYTFDRCEICLSYLLFSFNTDELAQIFVEYITHQKMRHSK